MAKWKCEICGDEFDNFHAQGFDNKIYCPLCYFKKENQELKEENKQFKDNWDKLKEWLESNWEESQDIWFVKIINKMQELEGSDKE